MDRHLWFPWTVLLHICIDHVRGEKDTGQESVEWGDERCKEIVNHSKDLSNAAHIMGSIFI